VEMMVPHHQGAIDMAVAGLPPRHNEQMRRPAQGIIVTQPQEIAALRMAVGEPLPPSTPPPPQPARAAPQPRRSRTAHMEPTRRLLPIGILLAAAMIAAPAISLAGQAPGSASAPDVPASHRDRVYAAEQFSNTVSVTDPEDNTLLGVIRLGEPQPTNF